MMNPAPRKVSPSQPVEEAFFSAGGITGALVRSTDWGQTALGPISSWPTSLKAIVGTILHSRFPMFLFWGEHLIQFYNDAYMPSFVEKHPAAMGQRGRECWREIWRIIWPQIDDVMTRGKASWNEDALVPIVRNGRTEDVYWTYGYSPVYDDQGRIGGTLVVCTETTSRVVAERALRQMSESQEITLNSIGDGVITTDLSGAVIRMNPVAERLTGRLLAAAKGKPVSEILDIVDEHTRARLESPIAQALRGGITVELATGTLLLRPDGTEIPIADSCAPLTSADGSVHGAVLVFRDLSSERAAAAVQQKYQNQLILADRMAAVGTLGAGVAHEINNPLTFVGANIETAIEEVRALSGGSASGRMKELEDMLLDAQEGATRVAKIVRGLKTFSRIEEQHIGVVDVIAVIELAINMAFNEIRHRARLVKDYGLVPLVDADDARLGQVFINLIVNAAQCLPDGKQDTNEIRVVTATDPEGRAVVEIRDNGPGIPSAFLGRIFDPFFTTKPVGVGTGLGLAISHNIVAGMGGDIFVQSEIGRGTVFRVVLPPSRSRESLPVSRNVPDPRSEHAARVLVVDDEPAIGLVMTRVLRDHAVTVVTTAQAALDLIARGDDFDVVLSDLMMPGMSGMEFYRTLTRLHPKFASRVVFVTGGAFTPEANEFLDQVCNERIEKPFEAHKLRQMIQKFAR